MNLQVIQFQYSFELIRLTCSQLSQTFQDIIRWDLGHRQLYFISSRIEFLNIIIAESKISEIKNDIMSASNPEALADHVSDLPSAKEPVLFLGFLFLQTDLFLAVGILDDLVQSGRNSRIQHLKIWEMRITLN